MPDDYINTMNLRPVMVAGRQIIRATIPLTTAPLGGGPYASGPGDISIFDAIKLTGAGSKTDIEIGPLFVFPSATDVADGLTQWEVTIAEALSDAGYSTALYGKWHLGSHDGRLPNDQGFDEWYGFPRTTDEAMWPSSTGYSPDIMPPE